MISCNFFQLHLPIASKSGLFSVILNCVPYVLMGQRALRAYVLMCQRALRAYVPMCLTCLRANVPYVLTCSRTNVTCVLMFSRALPAGIRQAGMSLETVTLRIE